MFALMLRVWGADLAEAGGAGGELVDLHRLVIIGVVLIIRVHVVIALRAGCGERERGGEFRNCTSSFLGRGSCRDRLTVKVACVLLRLQLRNELSFLPQQAVPVQLSEERVLLHFNSTTWGQEEQKACVLKNTQR